MARPAAAAAHRPRRPAPARRRLTGPGDGRERPLRVLHVADRPPGSGSGGAEVLLERVVRAQRRAGDEPHVLAGEVEHLGLRRALDLWDPAARRLVRARVAAVRPDVVHLHNVVRELSPSVVAVPGTPVVLHLHDLRALGAGEHHLPDPRAVADRLVLGPLVRGQVRRHVAAVVAVSEPVARAARAAGLPPVHVVPVPVPPPAVPPEPVERCWDVVLAATLAADKGADVLLRAFAQVAVRHPRARLVLAGDGPERARLLAAAAGLGDRVVLPGRLDAAGVSRALGRARVVVVPSLPALRPEGSTLTGAEAARHGRPLVTSDDPAAAEVSRAVGGDVVPAGDAAALAARLDHWLSSPGEAARAGARAEAAARDRYDEDAVAAGLRAVYDAVRTGGRHPIG